MMEKTRKALGNWCSNCKYEHGCNNCCGDKRFELKPELEAELTAAEEAMEKQKAKKVTNIKPRIYLGDGQHCTEATCPTCGREVYTHSLKFILHKYCPDCGQKLDWEV